MPVRRALPIVPMILLLAAGTPSAEPADRPVDPAWRVRPAQALLGVFGGSLGALLGGVAGYVVMPTCVYEGIEGEAVAIAAANRPCGELGVLAGVALGAVGGASGGIYGVGRNGGGGGSFLATAGGAAAGFMAGIALTRAGRPNVEFAYGLIAGTTTLSGLLGYHLTDRVRVGAGLERTEVRVAVMRF